MAPTEPTSTATKKSQPVKDPQAKFTKAWKFKKYRDGQLNLRAPARYMSITNKNSTTSPLLTLPAEIRNKIFAYASGGYDIYIAATDHTGTDSTYINRNGQTRYRRLYETNRVFTTILPQGSQYRDINDDDDLPNLALAQVSRQLYTETSLLPYMLNRFKVVGRLDKTQGTKYADFYYSAFDFWVAHRTPAQFKVITSIAPPMYYIRRYRAGDRPVFRKVFPSLRALDLTAGSVVFTYNDVDTWAKVARQMDLDASLDIIWPVKTHEWNPDEALERYLIKGPNHFEAILTLNQTDSEVDVMEELRAFSY